MSVTLASDWSDPPVLASDWLAVSPCIYDLVTRLMTGYIAPWPGSSPRVTGVGGERSRARL